MFMAMLRLSVPLKSISLSYQTEPSRCRWHEEGFQPPATNRRWMQNRPVAHFSVHSLSFAPISASESAGRSYMPAFRRWRMAS